MSTSRLIIQSIWCDNVTDKHTCIESRAEEGSTAREIRATAKSMGWRVNLHGGRDLCPKHDRLFGPSPDDTGDDE